MSKLTKYFTAFLTGIAVGAGIWNLTLSRLEASELSAVDLQYENLKYIFNISDRDRRILDMRLERASNQCKIYGTIYKTQLLKDFSTRYVEAENMLKEGKKKEAKEFILQHLCE